MYTLNYVNACWVALISLCTGQHGWGGDQPRVCGGPATTRPLRAPSKGKS